ncbi:ATP-binding protein [Streptomyces sp. NPDC008121]|uniref:sensor histidine kinase n=1 Tax=Streptomyces sp. NPDC008121 TaxID=3364809 RepID=UPI0036EA220B
MTSGRSLLTERHGPADSVDAVIAPYQRRAQLAQGLLRLFIVLNMVADLFPPDTHFPASFIAIGAYAGWSTVLLLVNTVRWLDAVWVPLAVDLAAMTGILAVAGQFSEEMSLPHNVFICVPLLAAFQYRPGVTMAATVAATAAFSAGVAAGRSGSGDPHWAEALFLGQMILVVGGACVLLSWIQRDKMNSIIRLAADRSVLVARVMSAEDRERSALAEILHDGALQNVLAARQDLDELQDLPGAAENLRRTRTALADASTQLRSSVNTLYPAVLENAGLGPALRSLAAETAERGGFSIVADYRTETAGRADQLIYRTARELFNNIVKHAHAGQVSVELRAIGEMVQLTISDDGVGITSENMDRSITEGHIGLASHRIRIEEAGGYFQISRNIPNGTVATVGIPF